MSFLELLKAAKVLLATCRDTTVALWDKVKAVVAFIEMLLPMLPKDPVGPHFVGATSNTFAKADDSAEAILANLDAHYASVGFSSATPVGKPDGHILLAFLAFAMKLLPLIVPFLGPK